MENQIKDTYNKIQINEDRKAEIAAAISRTKNKSNAWIGVLVAVTTVVVVLTVIPATRTQIVNAAANLIKVFTANNQEITVEQLPNESVVTIDYDENKSYSLVENDRLYLVVRDIKIDVTDQCSDTDYYRYEVFNNDGSRNIIFVGGTVANPGWIELIFDASGNYIANQMRIPDHDPETNPCIWQERAMNNEGVPCGNWELDKKLSE